MSRVRAIGLVALLAMIALAAAALIPGAHSGGDGEAKAGVAGRSSPVNALEVHQDAVFGSAISARQYGTFIAEREQGIDSSGRLASELDPVSPASFRAPVAAYRRYAERWAVALGRDVRPLRGSLKAGDRAGARRAWARAFADYLHLGAVYGLLPSDLNDQLAAVPSSLGAERFPGLHRIEKGLWTAEPLRGLTPVASALQRAVTRLQRVMPSVEISPLDYATRAHEILEDAQRDLMSGSQVPWSGAGVLGTAAGVAVTREVIRTLTPLLQGRENTLGATENNLAQLARVLASIRRADRAYPTVSELTRSQRERVDGSLAGALGALSQVPGTLETSTTPRIPAIAPHR